MAIIHCGFVPHQSKSINLTAGFRRNNHALPVRQLARCFTDAVTTKS